MARYENNTLRVISSLIISKLPHEHICTLKICFQNVFF